MNHGRPTESELWVEKYAPQTPVRVVELPLSSTSSGRLQEDLAVHKQKIEQVSRWLITSFSDHRGQSISNVSNANMWISYPNSDPTGSVYWHSQVRLVRVKQQQ